MAKTPEPESPAVDADDLADDEELVCAECGAAMGPDDLVCPQCGAEFGYYCPQCDEEVPPDATICPHCGAELEEGVEDDESLAGAAAARDMRHTAALQEVEFEYYCPECDKEVPSDATVCPHCGAELDEGFEDVDESPAETAPAVPRAEFCSNCGEPIGKEDGECPSCGVDLCPDCGTALGPDDTVCANCGAQFVFSCPNCGGDVPASADRCPQCGLEFEEIELDQAVEKDG
jgi:predicted amidophosphoribosyltransferase